MVSKVNIDLKNKMFSSICYMCLRNNIKIIKLDDDLSKFYENLTDYPSKPEAQFCDRCFRKLKNYFNFKKRCILALQILEKNFSNKKSIDMLHLELPEAKSSLGLCNTSNFKVYYYYADTKIIPLAESYNPNHPHIVTMSIPKTDCPTKHNNTQENINKKAIKEETMQIEVANNELDFIGDEENGETKEELSQDDYDIGADMDKSEHKIDFDKLGIGVKESHENDNSLKLSCKVISFDEFTLKHKKLDDKHQIDSDSDSSLDKFLAQIKNNKVIADTKKNGKSKKLRNNNKVVYDKEYLKGVLIEKFTRYGVVKDRKGNVLDLDVVLNSLEQLSTKRISGLSKFCIGRGPLKMVAIQSLSVLHERTVNYDSISFFAEHIDDEARVKEEFCKRRFSSDYTQYENRCETCIRGFKSKSTLEQHNKNAHDETNPFVCNICQMRCKTKNRYITHAGRHRMLHKCKKCAFTTLNKSSMLLHHNQHVGNKYTCQLCTKQFNAKAALNKHINRHHRPRHACVLCGSAHSTERGLLLHTNLRHPGEEFVQSDTNKSCDVCNITFITEDVYNKHFAISHEEVKEYSRRKKREGKKRKWKAQSYACHLCDAVGEHYSWLWQHLRVTHPEDDTAKPRDRPYLCDTCGKSFAVLSAYKDHQNLHSGARPYECAHCPKTFHKHHNLYMHEKRHKPPTYCCSYCGKKFMTSANLYTHKRTHIGDRRFVCEICGKGFLHNATLREHVNGVHYNIKKKRTRKTTIN